MRSAAMAAASSSARRDSKVSAISSILEFIVRICSSSRCSLSWIWSDLRGRRGISTRLPRASDASARQVQGVSPNMSPTPPNWIELDRTIWAELGAIDRKWLPRGNSQSGNRGSNPRSGISAGGAQLASRRSLARLEVDQRTDGVDWIGRKGARWQGKRRYLRGRRLLEYPNRLERAKLTSMTSDSISN